MRLSFFDEGFFFLSKYDDMVFKTEIRFLFVKRSKLEKEEDIRVIWFKTHSCD